MPKIVRVYACRVYDITLGQWERARQRYTLEEIAGFARAEPIMDDFEDVQRPTDEEIEANLTSRPLRGRD